MLKKLVKRATTIKKKENLLCVDWCRPLNVWYYIFIKYKDEQVVCAGYKIAQMMEDCKVACKRISSLTVTYNMKLKLKVI